MALPECTVDRTTSGLCVESKEWTAKPGRSLNHRDLMGCFRLANSANVSVRTCIHTYIRQTFTHRNKRWTTTLDESWNTQSGQNSADIDRGGVTEQSSTIEMSSLVRYVQINAFWLKYYPRLLSLFYLTGIFWSKVYSGQCIKQFLFQLFHKPLLEKLTFPGFIKI